MKRLVITLFVTTASFLPADELTLRTGEVVTYTKILKIEADGLRLSYPDGVRRVPVEMLTDEDMKRFNLNPKDAEKARLKREQEMKQIDAARKKDAAAAKKENEANKKKADNTPVLINVEQMKNHWIKNFPVPRTLDKDYRPKMKAYEALVAGIRSGQYDNLAQEKVLVWNIAELERTGNYSKAEGLRDDLKEVRAALAEEQELEQQRLAEKRARQADMIDAMATNSVLKELSDLNYNLRKLQQ